MLWLFVSALVFGGALIVAGLLGHDADTDHSSHVVGDAGLLAVFSLRNLTWACFAFGGIGLLGVLTHRSATVSSVSASIAGVLTLLGVHALFVVIRRTEADSVPLDVLVIGAPATLVLPFDTNGLGVISFLANGQVQEMPAKRAPNVEALESMYFTTCRIGWIENGIAVVEPTAN
ncbi:hypothetical protein [Gemmatimonas phototrophica]|uniref:Uncharacterized protein n=1 Tax=Gemmatimonas phototrophica TaxID=1379270 RepID=A0A143BJA0_9BACT|nr:hypothetical protein [Gemmatimonas phototrophica]AMW05136.1 hypothetical protein GEMMAAP_10525 [Gemmatimonas phototrophica]